MHAWRLYDHQAPHTKLEGFDPLDGRGGLFAPSRWNERGVRMVYASESPSLAVLETLAHLSAQDLDERMLIKIEIPDDATVEEVRTKHLVQLLRHLPGEHPEMRTREFGSRWAEEQRSYVLRVPSVVMPSETNLLLNPEHAEHAGTRVVSAELFLFDTRLRQRS